MMRALLILAALLSAALAPPAAGQGLLGLRCLGEDQLEDARVDLEHLGEDLEGFDVFGWLAGTHEDSPHVKQLTLPADLVIATPTWLVNIDLRVCGDVIILPTGSLTMYGATLRVDHGQDEGLVRVIAPDVGIERTTSLGLIALPGTLRLAPLSFVHGDPVLGLVSDLLFRHPERMSVLEGVTNPARVTVEAGGTLDSWGASFLRVSGVEARSPRDVVLRNTLVESVARGVYVFDADAVTIDRTTIEADAEALYLTTARNVAVTDSTLRGESAVVAKHVTGLDVVGSTLVAPREALYAFASREVSVRESAITGNIGAYFTSTTDVEVVDSIVTSAATGVFVRDTTDARLLRNTLVPYGSGARGVYVEGSDAAVDANVIEGFTTGVHLYVAEGTTVTCNRIAGNSRSVYVSTTHAAVVTHNDLAHGAVATLHALLAPDLDATGNHWGQPTGPEPGQVVTWTNSSVRVEPWATSAPACVP